MKKIFVLGGMAAALLISACGGEESKEEKSNTTSGESTGGKKLVAKENVPYEDPNKNLTNIRFDEVVHDFGTVPAVSENKHIFKFTNTGNVPLVVKDAKASCGCTIPKKPEKPIPPGEEGELEVIFKPKPGQEGTTVNKTVTVTANIPGGSTIVKITADVAKAM
ncbi:MAG: DUF1573 domain-containing protein [Crocinitomicaceae bacterium]|nr:DUF1573 domain-containing protein [Crocinitomicaceae bacterium]